MSDAVAFGDAETSALLCVKKADGRTFYYKVEGGTTIEMTQAEYEKETG